MKRFVSALLSIVLLLTLWCVCPANAYADAAEGEKPSRLICTLSNINCDGNAYTRSSGAMVTIGGVPYDVGPGLSTITFNSAGTAFSITSGYGALNATNVSLSWRSGSWKADFGSANQFQLSVSKSGSGWSCSVTTPAALLEGTSGKAFFYHHIEEYADDDVTPCTPKVLGQASTPAPTPAPHVHSFVTGTIYEATCNSDGLEGTYCSTCGFIKESSPISAFGYTLETYAQQKMDAAKSGQTIVLEFGELSSFPKSFMEKIAQKVAAGVSFEFRYKVNHKLQKIKIPAYSTVDTSLDWYGYGKMAELYGMN